MSSERDQNLNSSLPLEAPEKKQAASVSPHALEGAEFAHPADVAEHIENLPVAQRVSVLESLPVEHAAEALTELDEHVRVELIENLKPVQAASFFAEMSPDDAADVLDELEEDHRAEILGSLDHEDAEEIRNLMAFDPDTAGGVMNTEIIIISQDLTADKAIEQLRNEIEDKELAYYIYIVDDNNVLVGVLSLRDLFFCKSGTVLRDILPNHRAVSVLFDRDKEAVARILGRYNFMAVPVVDYEGRLLGVVTHDDVIDIIHEAATEDMQGMVGAGQDESVDTPWRDSVRMRLPWLVVNMVNSAFAAFVVSLFDGTIAQMTVLAVLMPIVANQAGNTGQQALAVMIRELAVSRLSRARAFGAVLRETGLGLTIGIVVSALVFGILGFFSANWPLAGVMSIALLLNMIVGATAGASIPLILRALGRDPAQASSIFLTMITDSSGFFIFLGLATIVLL
jgi:magnesium transporter